MLYYTNKGVVNTVRETPLKRACDEGQQHRGRRRRPYGRI